MPGLDVPPITAMGPRMATPIASATAQGVGARLARKEDDRLLRGRGQFVADIEMPGMQDVAFVRSPIAHGLLRSVTIPPANRSVTFAAADLIGVKAIRAASGLRGFKVSEQPVLAAEKVRYVGELVAMCMARTRAEAEDVAATISLDIDELPAVHDMLLAREPGAALLHEHWDDNVFLETFVDVAIAKAFDAPIKITREIRTARQSMAPIEGRGVVAHWDSRLEQLTLYSACQMPHIVRTGLAECLGLDHGMVRVVAPDVGGGFGYKGILLAEEVALSWLAMRCGHPVRWIEDRREHLTAGANCREHHYVITGYADRDGRLIGIDCEATVDSGAYSSYPFSACLEAAQIASILPGPYDFPFYRCRTYSAATNKCPILPYRGVARTGVCFALELVLDAIAHEAGIETHALRMKNLIRPEQMPFDNITNKHFDSGDYPQCLRRAVAAIDVQAVRQRQKRGEPDGRLIGLGFAVYCEQAAHGTSVYAGWGMPIVPGHERATARVTPDGGLELRTGVHSHGQGLETTLAQVAHEILGIEVRKIKVVHGDTALTPYSTGTWGSRCTVMAGGAVAAAAKEIEKRLAKIGAYLLQADPAEVDVANGQVVGPKGSVSIAEIARTWYFKPQDLPADADPGGLEVTAGYKPQRDTGTFSYAAHAVVVAIDRETGEIEIIDYAIVEDGGTLVNPMIVDGQIQGGLAQGIGTALYEEMPFDRAAQPLATTFADYLLPGSTNVPAPRIEHMATPSPYTEFGVKGIGEGGAIAPPAAIANAVNDALKALGAEVLVSPITPHRVLEAIAVAGTHSRSASR
jgi:carbon-monoxide dehydrogenase large subunit